MNEIFQEGDRVRLQDEKGRMVSLTLKQGETFHTHKGWIRHDDLIGKHQGSIIMTNSGMRYQALTPLYPDFVLGMPRGATIIYPKDSAMIIGYGDIRHGQKVVEAGAGSGACTEPPVPRLGDQVHDQGPAWLVRVRRRVAAA